MRGKEWGDGRDGGWEGMQNARMQECKNGEQNKETNRNALFGLPILRNFHSFLPNHTSFFLSRRHEERERERGKKCGANKKINFVIFAILFFFFRSPPFCPHQSRACAAGSEGKGKATCSSHAPRWASTDNLSSPNHQKRHFLWSLPCYSPLAHHSTHSRSFRTQHCLPLRCTHTNATTTPATQDHTLCTTLRLDETTTPAAEACSRPLFTSQSVPCL